MQRLVVIATTVILVLFWNWHVDVTHKPTPYVFPELKMFPPMPLPSYQVTEEGVDLGRYLFYDPILSSDSTVSCNSCHKQKFAFADVNRRFSIGVNQRMGTRNALPLFNLAWYSHLFWDGRASSIEEQVVHPVRNKQEMNLEWTIAEHRIRNSEFYRKKFETTYGNI